MTNEQNQNSVAEGRSESKALLGDCGQQATPHATLIEQLLDSRIPKSEREHAAAREIERLRAALSSQARRHTHECVRCGLCYTPVPVEADTYSSHSEDCPNCGCDGTLDA